MAVDDELAAGFQAHRAHLQRVAYAILGSVTEAEDAVQEAWLRLQRQPDATAVRDLRAWLTTAVSRLALDTLNSARVRREQYVGPWLPEPWVRELGDEDPADRITLDESISLALLIVLEQLTPAERTAFLLHDVFGFSFSQAGEIVGRSAAASRQLAARARQRVDETVPDSIPPVDSNSRSPLRSRAPAPRETLSSSSPSCTPTPSGARTEGAGPPRRGDPNTAHRRSPAA